VDEVLQKVGEMMDNYPATRANGFDIYPLVYKFDAPAREWNERKPDRTYSASVVICREGETPSGANGRVFKLPEQNWESLGVAKRAAVQRGLDIIGGRVPGESMAGV